MAGTNNQSIKELVYEGILNDIIQGVYPANSILNERTLVEKYGGSKTSVREALVQLCSEGILKNIPRYGYQLLSSMRLLNIESSWRRGRLKKR